MTTEEELQELRAAVEALELVADQHRIRAKSAEAARDHWVHEHESLKKAFVALQQRAKGERERCAKICDAYASAVGIMRSLEHTYGAKAAVKLARRIRDGR